MTHPRGFVHAGPLPHPEQDAARIPAHWLFARLGKRALRPGGLAMTKQLLNALTIQSTDDVIEFAPGLAGTARLALARLPASFIGIEANQQAARVARDRLTSKTRILVRSADQTGLDSETASVVYGEALLTLQRPSKKRSMVNEAHRLLCVGGRFGIHELAIMPDDIPDFDRYLVTRDLKRVLRGGALPMTAAEWRRLLETRGFEIQTEVIGPVRLLAPAQLLEDEGALGAMRVAWNLTRDAAARARIMEVRRMLTRHATALSSIVIVGRKLAPSVPAV